MKKAHKQFQIVQTGKNEFIIQQRTVFKLFGITYRSERWKTETEHCPIPKERKAGFIYGGWRDRKFATIEEALIEIKALKEKSEFPIIHPIK